MTTPEKVFQLWRTFGWNTEPLYTSEEDRWLEQYDVRSLIRETPEEETHNAVRGEER